MLFCFFKLFVAVGKGLKFAVKFAKGCYALSCYVYPVRAWAAVYPGVYEMGSRSRCICKSTISEVIVSYILKHLNSPYDVTVIRFRQLVGPRQGDQQGVCLWWLDQSIKWIQNSCPYIGLLGDQFGICILVGILGKVQRLISVQHWIFH